ncbi:MAG: PTS mannose transporter subunit IIB [Coprobacillus sp.]|jgi:fructoselysine and glucoselysine-specific PTS system IIA component|nr:PTS mannose transporter subunit IIB [Coprobacillus sp.]
MRQFIIASHGELASGMVSAAEMIIGDITRMKSCNLSDYKTIYDLYEDVKSYIVANPETEYVLMTDLLGGSVNNLLMQLCEYKNVFVVTGINLGLLLELYLSSENEQMKVVALKAIESSKNNIRLFAYPINEYVEQNEQKEVNLW